MKRLLLDTTFLIDRERAQAASALIDDEDDVAIAAITAAELLVGAELGTGKAKDARASFVADVLDTIPILPYDINTAHSHAHLLATVRKTGRRRGAHDLIIAATALAAGRTLVTADEKGFVGLPGLTTISHR